MCPAVVPCATADEESGSSLKLGSRVDQPLVLIGTRKLVLENVFFQTNLCIKILLSANQTLALSLIYHVHYILFIPHPWVWLDFLSTFVLTHSSFLQKKTQTLCPIMLSRGTVLHPALPVD